MKLNKEMRQKCFKWVSINGLYPQPGGAPVNRFCKAMNIDDATYRRWMKIADFAEGIKKARDAFREDTIDEVVNALKKKALGYTITLTDAEYKAQVVREYDPQTGKKIKEYTTDQGVKVQEKTRDVHMAADTAAGIFLLTNLDPENWKNRRDAKTDVDVSLDNEEAPVIVFKSSDNDPVPVPFPEQ